MTWGHFAGLWDTFPTTSGGFYNLLRAMAFLSFTQKTTLDHFLGLGNTFPTTSGGFYDLLRAMAFLSFTQKTTLDHFLGLGNTFPTTSGGFYVRLLQLSPAPGSTVEDVRSWYLYTMF